MDPDEIAQQEYDETIRALLLQSLKVLASVPEERLQVFEAVIKEPRCGALSYLVPWANECGKLRAVAIGPEQGLDRLLTLVTLKLEATNDDGILRALVNPFTETVANINASIRDESTLRNRAAALSHLQCANLGCTTIFCPWDKTRTKGKLCNGCKTVRYCSEECQKADWKGHKRACKLIGADN